MKLIPDKTTVVLAGAFNPAILTPQWVAVNGLGHPAGQEFQVEMLAPIAGGGQQRFTFEGLSYTAGFKQVMLHLQDVEGEPNTRAIRALANILAQLPHTPVLGLGFNFAFSLDEPTAQFLGLLTVHDGAASTFPGNAGVVARRWGNLVQWEDCLVNIESEVAGAQAGVSFNFHYAVSSAAQAEAILRRPNVFGVHRERAVAAATAITAQALE